MWINKDDIELLKQARDNGKNINEIIESAEYIFLLQEKRKEVQKLIFSLSEYAQGNLSLWKYDELLNNEDLLSKILEDYTDYLIWLEVEKQEKEEARIKAEEEKSETSESEENI